MRLPVIAALALVLICCRPQRESALPAYGAVPDFQLVAQDGRPFDSGVLNGMIWVADFIYTNCPGPCPRMTSQMRQVQEKIHKMRAVKLLSFTVDPARDTPPVLLDYARLHHAALDDWYFLTGDRATLQKLDKDVFKLGDVDGALMHSTRFALVDGKRQIRGYYDTSESDSLERLVRDILTLARERT